MPNWIEYVWCPDDRSIGQAHNWWENDEGVKWTMSELKKLKAHASVNIIQDLDISHIICKMKN